LSRSPDFAPPDAKVVRTIAEAQAAIGRESPLMVIGGAEIYRLSLAAARRIELTLVHTQVNDGDTFFSEWRRPEWREVSRERHEPDEKNPYAYSFITLERG
jgi:dihydrofolate reductase